MKAPIFPVFALKTIKDQVVIGGGGGNEHFGKKNGVVVLDETTYKDLDYLETEDIILGIEVYEPGVNDLELKEDDLDWDEHNEYEDEEEEVKANETTASSKDKSNVKTTASSKDKSNVETTANVKTTETSKVSNSPLEKNSDVFYLTCRGTNFFYLVKLKESKLHLVKKVEKVVTKQFLINSLFLVINKQLFCILDILTNYNKLDNLIKRKHKKVNSLAEHEEYIYSLFKKNGKILVEREEGRTDIPENWESFFISGNKIHKVVKEGDVYTFVYRQKKHEYEKEIGEIICNRELLIFYLKGVDSQLFFVDDSTAVYNIPKITCMSVEGDFTSVGTAEGFGYLFKGQAQVCKRKLCDFAITGISFKAGDFYFSSYNGLVDRMPIISLMALFIKIGGALLVLLAIILAFLFKK